jgi:hypothetical protein
MKFIVIYILMKSSKNGYDYPISKQLDRKLE